MEFDGEVVKFYVYDAMKYPTDLSCVYSVDILDSLQQRHFDLCFGNDMNIVLSNALHTAYVPSSCKVQGQILHVSYHA